MKDFYQEQLRKEYNLDNLFQHQRKENTVAKSISVFDTAMVEYRKETLFFKVKVTYLKFLNILVFQMIFCNFRFYVSNLNF